MAEYEKPLPSPTLDTKPYWEFCKKHELRMQKCMKCGYIRNPPNCMCPKCQSLDSQWVKLSGKGKVYTFTIMRHVYDKAFAHEIPYAVASIELEEGPRMVSGVTGCKPEDIKVDMPVDVYFEDINEAFALPKFRPAAGAGARPI